MVTMLLFSMLSRQTNIGSLGSILRYAPQTYTVQSAKANTCEARKSARSHQHFLLNWSDRVGMVPWRTICEFYTFPMQKFDCLIYFQADYFGRRWGMGTGCFITIVATLVQTFSPHHGIGVFIFGRVLIGVGQGMALS